VFAPGLGSVTWMGNLNYLAPIEDFSESPYGEDDNRTPFPVRPKEKRSYAQSCVVWIKSVGLQVCNHGSQLQGAFRSERISNPDLCIK